MTAKSFRHSGKLGDIIYSLPAVKALGGGDFYLDYRTESFGKPPLGKTAALMMAALLETQDYIQSAQLYEGQSVDYNLDSFRNEAIPVHFFNFMQSAWDEVTGHLFGPEMKALRRQFIPKVEFDLPQMHWRSVGLPGTFDADTPWVTGIEKLSLADIVVCRTQRNSGDLNWSALSDLSNRSVFVGFEEEWRSFCASFFPITFYQVKDLLELTRIVAGARVFVGNQSFALAVADAMSIPRIIELWSPSPNRVIAQNAHRELTPQLLKDYVGD